MNTIHTDYNLVAATKFRTNGKKTPKPMGLHQVFGENTFGLEQMKDRLPKAAYEKMQGVIERGEALDTDIADAVAQALKDWAIERGASHYTHWFQPLTGSTAEKHDSFMAPTGSGSAINKFTGRDLLQGEPDASSFPNGGLRATSAARGYTAWDPTSPPFIVENAEGSYLAIPTVFVSWTGEALDHKLPLLRSMEALNKQALRVLRLFGENGVSRVFSTVGTEQEYFLIEEEYFFRRPDLVATGRTVTGAKPPRGQELDDHYFGSIPDRVLSVMMTVERELYRLGIPVKTRHNEVAPSQYEIAPIFENTNLAADHNHIVMSTLQRVARKYGLIALLHEKPFAGVNGSGKHNNWSLATDTGLNLLDPGDEPLQNKRFLFFCAAVLKAVYRHQDLLRISVASAGNDHRLGANEAPPAILSVFLGTRLENVFERLLSGEAAEEIEDDLMDLGASVLPRLHRDADDRNRTSPFAFIGNRFEFRAVGSRQTVSFPNVVLNLIVAEALDDMASELELKVAANDDDTRSAFETCANEVICEVIEEVKPIIFGGDGYSEEWHVEAEARGLLNLRTTLDALDRLRGNKNVHLFQRYGVMSERELESRYHVWLEQYLTTLNIEAESLERIARTMILPAGVEYLNRLMSAAELVCVGGVLSGSVAKTAVSIGEKIDALDGAADELATAISQSDEADADHGSYQTRMVEAMGQVRSACDALERVVPQELWPLPTYRDMLFVK